MQIDDIYTLLDDNKITLKSDRLIVENILNAHRDWDFEIESLNQFLEALETELNGKISEKNLKQKLKEYNKNSSNSWKIESLCYLIDIFKITGYSNLRLLFDNLITRLEVDSEKETIFEFRQKGYPIIRIHNTFFEIKAIDFNTFRCFNYNEIKEVKLIDPKKLWWYKLLYSTLARAASKNDPINIKVIKRNGGDWKYLTSSKQNINLQKIIIEINSRIQ